MQYDEFIERVQIEGEIDSSDEAVRATKAVLETLGECVYRTEVADLAAQLPRGIREFLTAQQPPENNRGSVERYTLEQFYNQIGARTDSRHPEAVRLAHAVAVVLMDAVSGGEIADIKEKLPNDFAKLFDRGL
jgi:uncharacterized protein (DUF2267 family)